MTPSPGQARPVHDVLVDGIGWGSIAGAVSGALFVVPMVVWNGPWEALLIYPPAAAIAGAASGAVLGLVVAGVLAGVRPTSRSDASLIGGSVSAACVVWTVFVVPLLGLWLVVLALCSGAVAARRVQLNAAAPRRERASR